METGASRETGRKRPAAAAWEALRDFQRAGRGQDAAALTYYAMLAFVPGVLAVVALIGLLGRHPQTTNALLDGIDRIGPDSAVETFRGTIQGIITDKGGAGALLGVGLVGAIASATAWLEAFLRVAAGIAGSGETLGFARRKAREAVTAILFGIGLAVLGVLVVVTGPLATRLGDWVGAGDAAVTAWSIGKWPVALAVAVGMVAALYRVALAPASPPRRSLLSGAGVAVAAWAAASIGFSLYVASIGSYNATYGALGGVIVFLIWMWIANAALIVGLATADRLT